MATKAVVLPRSLHDEKEWKRLIERYKEWRLQSLQQEPQSFGSSYEREVAFPDDIWESRLNNRFALNIVTVELPGSGTTPPIERNEEGYLALESKWLAALTLVGPLDAKNAAHTYEERMHLSPNTVDFGLVEPGIKSTYVLSAMYVEQTSRRRGLATSTIERAKELALEMEGGERVMLALILDYDNTAAMRSYERSGFKVVHQYYFEDTRSGEPIKTLAAVMRVDVGILRAKTEQ